MPKYKRTVCWNIDVDSHGRAAPGSLRKITFSILKKLESVLKQEEDFLNNYCKIFSVRHIFFLLIHICKCKVSEVILFLLLNLMLTMTPLSFRQIQLEIT